MSLFQKNYLQNLNHSYQGFLKELRSDSLEQEDTLYLSEDFILDFKGIINNKSLNDFSPKNFYWLNLIDQLVDTIDITENFESGDIDYEEAVNFLESSDYLQLFLDNQETDPLDTLKEIIQLQEFQIVSFYNLHINRFDNWLPGGPVAYRPIGELGEKNNLLFLTRSHYSFELPEHDFTGFLPVLSFNPKKGILEIDNEDEIIECAGTKENQHLFTRNNDSIKVVGSISHDLQEKVQRAFSTLEKLTPDLYDFLFSYTKVVVPVHEEGIVSYSMDILPGYSCINIFDRDFVDLLDDLIHETGHHYLNAILEGEDDLIVEDDEKIFYSPWRRALRPVRGLYHAVCTFYWAFVLFNKLSKKTESFAKEEVNKIHLRHLEESFMILACESDLIKAHQMEKITDVGFKHVKGLLEQIKAMSTDIEHSRSFLENNDPNLFNEYKNLENTVMNFRKGQSL